MSLPLDQSLSELPTIEPPDALREQVLSRVIEEMKEDAPRTSSSFGTRRRWAYPTLAAAAALLIFVSLPPEATGPELIETHSETTVETAPDPDPDPAEDPIETTTEMAEGNLDGMQPKGDGWVVPQVEMEMSFRRDDIPRRLEQGAIHQVGDQLYFRARVDANAELALIRIAADSTVIAFEQSVPSGTSMLEFSPGRPLEWLIEEGEGTAIFALLARAPTTDEPTPDWNEVVRHLGGSYDPNDANRVCTDLLDLDVRCDARTVLVEP